MERISKSIYFGVIGILVMFFFPACQLNEGVPGNDLKMTIEELREGSYKGGGIIVAPDNNAINHVVEGMLIPIKMADFDVIENAGNSCPYVDKEETVSYGYLEVKSASREKVDLAVTLLDKTGDVRVSGKPLSICLDGEADLDSDGDVDIRLIPSNRQQMASASFLQFVSSEEGRHYAIYRLASEYFPAKKYPSGLIGVSPSGRLIAIAEAVGAGARSIASSNGASLSPYLSEGDFIINPADSKMEEVGSVSLTKSGASYSASESGSDYNEILSKAFGVVQINIDGDACELAQKYYDTQTELPLDSRAYISILNYSYNLPLYRNGAAKLDLNLSTRIGIDISVSVNVLWLEVNTNISIVGEIKDKIELAFNLDKKWEKNYEKEVYRYRSLIWVFGIPCDLDVPIYLGVNGSVSIAGNANLGVEYTGRIGIENINAGARLEWFGPRLWFNWGRFVNSHSFTPIASYSANGSASIKPYFKISPSIGILYVVYPRIEIKTPK